MTDASIIISTRDHADSLARCLRSLAEQDLEAERFEVVVVDNGSSDGTPELLARWAEEQSGRRAVSEPRAGLQLARHAGARAAKAELLVFSDDDATFAPGWLRAFVETFAAHPELAAAGGPVEPRWEVPPPPWLEQRLAGRDAVPEFAIMEPFAELRIGPECFFFGVNMAVRKEALRGAGGFRPELVGPQTLGSGETGLLRALRARRELVGYVPGARVFHHIPARRMTPAALARWAWHGGPGEMYERWAARAPSKRALVREALGLCRRHARGWVRATISRGRTDPRAIQARFDSQLGFAKLHFLWLMLAHHDVRAALEVERSGGGFI